jgi:protein TonB
MADNVAGTVELITVSKHTMGRRRFWALLAICAAFGAGNAQAEQQSGLRTPRKIKDVKPIYPAQSLAAGNEGVVIVELKVAASGEVTDARVLRSECRVLNEAALTAVRGWRFEEVLVNGAATPFAVTAEVPFRLPEKLKSRAGRPGACRWVEATRLLR